MIQIYEVENPISAPTKTALIVTATLAAVGVGIYFLSRPAQAASIPIGPPATAGWTSVPSPLPLVAGQTYRFSYNPTSVGTGHAAAIFANFVANPIQYQVTSRPADWPSTDPADPARVYYEAVASRSGTMPTVGKMNLWVRS